MLRVQTVCKNYGRITILDNVDFIQHAGESVALVGESGSGKSTLLHLIAGIDDVDIGHISVGGVDVTTLGDAGRAKLRRDQLALIFQQFNLIPSLNVAANIAFQARLAGKHDTVWCDKLAARLGLTELLNRYPEHLSGGQAQRVAIARALAVRPKLLLADEPTGNLDEATGDEVLALMLELVAETNIALLFVTHSTRLAAKLSRTVTLRAGKLV